MSDAGGVDGAWTPDVLGHGFEQRSLALAPDDEGEVVATLVRAPQQRSIRHEPLRDLDVLYVHGWSDYFFQRDLAGWFTDRGARFFALDLRKYGRSLRPYQTPGDIRALSDYDEEIDAAVALIDTARHGRRLALVGHSTGGLTLTLWAAHHPGAAAAIILNSPWLELQAGPAARQVLSPLVSTRARVDPLGGYPVVDLGFYTRAQRQLGSLPDAPDGWRPERGFPTHPGWLAAVLAGHREIAAGVDLTCPALVILSTGSTSPLNWREEMTSTDAVLVVDDIARAATRIRPEVTVARIDGAVHDVFLSAPVARNAAYDVLDRWVTAALAGGRRLAR